MRARSSRRHGQTGTDVVGTSNSAATSWVRSCFTVSSRALMLREFGPEGKHASFGALSGCCREFGPEGKHFGALSPLTWIVLRLERRDVVAVRGVILRAFLKRLAIKTTFYQNLYTVPALRLGYSHAPVPRS